MLNFLLLITSDMGRGSEVTSCFGPVKQLNFWCLMDIWPLELDQNAAFPGKLKILSYLQENSGQSYSHDLR